MYLQINRFGYMSEQDQKDIVNLIKIGNEANSELIHLRMDNSLFTAYLRKENEIIGTATIKRPELSYRTYVFEKAGLIWHPENIPLELGYVFLSPKYRNQGLAFELCHSLIKLIPMQPIFATTREDNDRMKLILRKLHFKREGQAYENRSRTKLLEFYSIYF